MIVSGASESRNRLIVAALCCFLVTAAAAGGLRKWNSGRPTRRQLKNIASGRHFIDALSTEVAELEAKIAIEAETIGLDAARKEHEKKIREYDENVTQVLTHLDKCVGGGKIAVARRTQIHRAEGLGDRISKNLLSGLVDG